MVGRKASLNFTALFIALLDNDSNGRVVISFCSIEVQGTPKQIDLAPWKHVGALLVQQIFSQAQLRFELILTR